MAIEAVKQSELTLAGYGQIVGDLSRVALATELPPIARASAIDALSTLAHNHPGLTDQYLQEQATQYEAGEAAMGAHQQTVGAPSYSS